MPLAPRVSALATAVAGEVRKLRNAASIAYASTLNTDAATAAVFTVVLTGDATLAAPTNATNGRRLLWALTASGAVRTVTLSTGAAGTFTVSQGVPAATIAVAVGKTAFLTAVYLSSTDRWHALAVDNGG